MSDEKDGGLAFPAKRLVALRRVDGGVEHQLAEYPGMTLRDWVMGQCIAAVFGQQPDDIAIHEGETWQDATKRAWRDIAEAAAIAADAMLEARK